MNPTRRPVFRTPPRGYCVLAALRLAKLIQSIRTKQANVPITIVCHSQSNMVGLAAAFFGDALPDVTDPWGNVGRCVADAYVLANPPYSVANTDTGLENWSQRSARDVSKRRAREANRPHRIIDEREGDFFLNLGGPGMNALLSIWLRRAGIAASVMVLTAIVTLIWRVGVSHTESADWNTGDWMKRLILVPTLLALLTFLVATILVQTSALAATPKADAEPSGVQSDPAKPFMAQVVGLEWLNPIQRRDYPTEWQLLWTMGLVKPNANDDMVRTDPQSFTTLQSIGALVYGNEGKSRYSTRRRCSVRWAPAPR